MKGILNRLVSPIEPKWLNLFFILVLFVILKLSNSDFINNIEATIISFSNTMYLDNDYINPSFSGVNFYSDAPLIYWLHAVLLKLELSTPLGHRILHGFFGSIQILTIFYLSIRVYTESIAWKGILLYICTPLVFIMMGLLNSEIIFAFFMIQVFLSGWLVLTHNSLLAKIIFYFSLGFSFLIYGLLSIFYLGLVVTIYHVLMYKEGSKIYRLFSIIGVAIFIFICIPWLFYAQAQDPKFIYNFFYAVHAENFIFLDLNNIFSFVLLSALLLVAVFPWTLLLLKKDMSEISGLDSISKYHLAIVLGGSLLFTHYRLHEFAIFGVIIYPIVITIVDALNKQDYIDISTIKKIIFVASSFTFVILIYIYLQNNLGINIKISVSCCFMASLILPISALSDARKGKSTALLGKLILYNIIVLTLIMQYHRLT